MRLHRQAMMTGLPKAYRGLCNPLFAIAGVDFGIVIQMFWREHAPPHFHALYAEHEALVDIRTLEVIEGRLPKRALSLTIEWAIEHREELMEDWSLCQAKQLPRRIAPLE
jgi:hypothetical protein